MPGARRELVGEFAAALAAWEWDVALLQEVPPWWAAPLAQACGAQERSAPTSRNALGSLRRALARRAPDAMKSNGGGANAILARGTIASHRALRLRVWPERRVAQLACLADGTAIANFHGSARAELAADELSRLWRDALAWADGAPLVLGGDLNLRAPHAPAGAVHAAERDVDHVFAVGMRAVGAERLSRRAHVGARTFELSDHVPLLALLERTS